MRAATAAGGWSAGHRLPRHLRRAGADLALLVAEPTVSGVHDLERILAHRRSFRRARAGVLNKADLNPAHAGEIAAFCAGQRIQLVVASPTTMW